MSRMRVVADDAIPLAEMVFKQFGEVELVPGEGITPARVKDADLLMVRSITRVDSALLQGSAVGFVASATTGVDHVDQAFLAAAGIRFASAAGCNSNSVAEYVAAALLTVSGRRGTRLQGKSLGVVGVGRVGSLVARAGRILGLEVRLNDPPLAQETGSPEFMDLDELMDADFVTLHVPLTRGGAHPTFYLFNEDRLKRLSCKTVLINTSRGPVVEGSALGSSLQSGRLGGAVLDVWEGEPHIDYDLLGLLLLGTPHVAGYSIEGKLNGTRMIYEAACQFLGCNSRWSAVIRPLQTSSVNLREHEGMMEDALRAAVSACYDISADDRRLRAGRLYPLERRGDHFLSLRKNYPVRFEFSRTTVRVGENQEALAGRLTGLGFQVEQDPTHC